MNELLAFIIISGSVVFGCYVIGEFVQFFGRKLK